MANFSNVTEYFLSDFLSKTPTAIPKSAQWIMVFDGFPAGIRLAASFEPRAWKIDEALALVTNSTAAKNKGCLFCQALEIPGESLTVSQGTPLQYGGYIFPNVMQGREAPGRLRTQFLDTNISFAENVIRPWTLATAHFGLIARSEADPRQYRTNITFYQLGSFEQFQEAFPIKKITFYGACPISVGEKEYNYVADTSAPVYSAEFLFNYYQVETGKDAGNKFFEFPFEPKPRNEFI